MGTTSSGGVYGVVPVAAIVPVIPAGTYRHCTAIAALYPFQGTCVATMTNTWYELTQRLGRRCCGSVKYMLRECRARPHVALRKHPQPQFVTTVVMVFRFVTDCTGLACYLVLPPRCLDIA